MIASTLPDLSEVHYVRFKRTPRQSRRFRGGEDKLYLVVEHSNDKHRARIKPDVWKSLAVDLEP